MEKEDNTEHIHCFTIPALTAMIRDAEAGSALLNDQLIALCDSQMATFRFPCRFDAIIISVCTQGESTFISNLQEYTHTEGSLFVCGPKNILQVQSSNNFRSNVLIISPQLLGETHISMKNMLPMFIKLAEHPCLPLSTEDTSAVNKLIRLIKTEVRTTVTTSFTEEVVKGLISTTIAKIGDILLRYKQQHPDPENPRHNRAEEYFKQFMHLLGEHYKQERSVGFYAQKMCITPKYLTTLIKRVSNRSVSEWIDGYVILEAKTLLMYSTMSIQEVAYYLNFPNQSFFGSYFKRNTNMSPSQYKLQ